MRIALVHDWLVTYGGAERVLEEILKLYPGADLYSLIDFIPEGERGFLLGKRARTSFIQRMPLAQAKYRSYLPLMPAAIERFDLSEYDLVISCSHAVAKGVRTREGRPHVCYCFTPMRYAWSLRDQYLRDTGLDRGLRGLLARAVLGYMRRWDLRTSRRVTSFIASSAFISERIKRAYGRGSTVIYPPVDTENFTVKADKDDFYLAGGRMVQYKKMGLIVEAFARMPGRRLVVIGEGPELGKLKSMAAANTDLLGYQPSGVLRDYMQRARAFLFAAEEDFGIMPVEAQACGTPVIAFGRGGATETVVEDRTGVFFREQTAESLIEAVERFENMSGAFDPEEIRRNAERFGREKFRREFRDFVERLLPPKYGRGDITDAA